MPPGDFDSICDAPPNPQTAPKETLIKFRQKA